MVNGTESTLRHIVQDTDTIPLQFYSTESTVLAIQTMVQEVSRLSGVRKNITFFVKRSYEAYFIEAEVAFCYLWLNSTTVLLYTINVLGGNNSTQII